ncbi:MAG: hypothetical protein GDA49_02830 [Rhodospirillales bacterium]|nr:hypothetical protein [Rhodospirillales bacterium]
MWIGIFVLITFGGAALACLYISIMAAREGKWHVFGALLLPAFGIGGTIIMLIWKPVLLELFGDPNLEDVPASAQLLTGDALAAAHSDVARFGLRYNEDTGTFHWYDENHTADGGFKGMDDTGFTWSGGWDIVDDQLCLTLGQDINCTNIYTDGDNYYQVNHRDEIVNRAIEMRAGVVEINDGAVALSDATLLAIIPGHTLSGESFMHYGDPFYGASFAADGDAVTVRRGTSADNLSETESGTYRIEDGELCLAGVLNIAEECFEVVPSVRGFDIARGNGRVKAAVTTLE